jgi:hypothetical protein
MLAEEVPTKTRPRQAADSSAMKQEVFEVVVGERSAPGGERRGEVAVVTTCVAAPLKLVRQPTRTCLPESRKPAQADPPHRRQALLPRRAGTIYTTLV